jgi:hypothetical protein
MAPKTQKKTDEKKAVATSAKAPAKPAAVAKRAKSASKKAAPPAPEPEKEVDHEEKPEEDVKPEADAEVEAEGEAPAEPSEEEQKLKDIPKKPQSSYLIYSNEIRPSFAKEHTDLKGTQVTSAIGKMWMLLSDEEKKVYQEKAKEAKEAYQQALVDYEKKWGEAPPKKASKNGAMKYHKPPSKPATPFLLFSAAYRKKHYEKLPKKTQTKEEFAAFGKLLGKEWENIKNDKKKMEVYIVENNRLKDLYDVQYEEYVQKYGPDEASNYRKEKASRTKERKARHEEEDGQSVAEAAPKRKRTKKAAATQEKDDESSEQAASDD